MANCAAIIGNAHNVVITSSDEIARELLPGYKKHPVSISKIMESLRYPALTGDEYFDHHMGFNEMLQKGWHRQVFIWLPLGLVMACWQRCLCCVFCAVFSHRISAAGCYRKS